VFVGAKGEQAYRHISPPPTRIGRLCMCTDRSRTAVNTALLSARWDLERSTMSLRHCAGMLAVLLALSGTVCAQVAPCNKSQVRKQSCLEYLDVADVSKHTRTRHDVMLTERHSAMQSATSLANCPPAMHARALAGAHPCHPVGPPAHQRYAC
jgi:hypothetical protein